MATILVVPMLSVTQLNADSNYVIMREVIPKIIDETDWLFEILWPQNGADWRYQADGFFDHPNIVRRPMYFDPAKMRQVLSFDPRAWHKLLDYRGQYHDLIWNNTVEIADALKFFHPRYVDNARSILVNFHHYVMHHSLNYPTQAYQHVLMRQLLGSIPADANVVNSDHTLQMLDDNMQEYLSEEMRKQITASITKIGYGTLPDVVPQGPRHDTFTFAYNHRLQDYKNWRTTFTLFERLWQKRQDFQVQLFALGSDQHVGEVARLPFVNVLDNLTSQESYYEALARCHANVTHSQHETFCIAIVESLGMGHRVIAPNGVTFPEITGGHADLFRSEDQSLRFMDEAIDNHRDVQSEAVKHALSHHTSRATASRVVELFRELLSRVTVRSTLRRPETWEKLITSQDEWKLDDLRNRAYNSRSKEGRALAAGQSFPMVKIKRLANELGYIDSWSSRNELWLRREQDL